MILLDLKGKVNLMERENQIMITTSEAAELLSVKPSTIHQYVKAGKIKPVYEENWQIDATKLFYKNDIELLKKQLEKPGITTGEAAELLGVHPTTVSLYINQGELHAEKKKYRGRNIFFISPKEIERFKSEYINVKKRERKEYYDKETGYAWFQSFKDRKGNANNRILVDEDGQPFLLTSEGEKILYAEIDKKGYKPVNPIKDIPYKNKRGFAKFRFSETEAFYQIVELFYKYLGPKNTKILLDDNREIEVMVRPVLIEEIINEDVYKVLKEALIEGEVTKRIDAIYIDSDVEILAIAAPSNLKQKIKADAEEQNLTMEELVIRILNQYYSIGDDQG